MINNILKPSLKAKERLMKQESRLCSEKITFAIVYRQKGFAFYRNQMIQ